MASRQPATALLCALMKTAMRENGRQWGSVRRNQTRIFESDVCLGERKMCLQGMRGMLGVGGGRGFATTTTSTSSTRSGAKSSTATVTASSAASTASSKVHKQREAAKENALYFVAVAVATLGATYASVPLYRLFCQATGFGGTTARVDDIEEKLAEAQRRASSLVASNATPSSSSATIDAATDAAGATKDMTSLRPITVEFTSEVAASLPWKVRTTYAPHSIDAPVYIHTHRISLTVS